MFVFTSCKSRNDCVAVINVLSVRSCCNRISDLQPHVLTCSHCVETIWRGSEENLDASRTEESSRGLEHTQDLHQSARKQEELKWSSGHSSHWANLHIVTTHSSGSYMHFLSFEISVMRMQLWIHFPSCLNILNNHVPTPIKMCLSGQRHCALSLSISTCLQIGMISLTFCKLSEMLHLC